MKSIAERILSRELPQGYEIQESDIGSRLGLLLEGFGPVLPQDAGLRVYCRDNVTQMENFEQRDERLKRRK